MRYTQRLRCLLRGHPARAADWMFEPGWRWPLYCVAVSALGSALYGSTMGLWRSPLQAAYSAAKFPAVIFLTALGNALLNGILAQLLGAGLSFRQAAICILMSFCVAALILGSCSPLMWFLLVNTPTHASGALGRAVTLVAHVTVIACAGVIANHRMLLIIRHYSGSGRAAWQTLLAWLAGNLLLGSQVSWILRPFVGLPTEPVTFLSKEPLRGNFFESLGEAFLQFFG